MYGVDQCRVCGTHIEMRSTKQREAQELAMRKCAIPEKEWRARGYLCPPTKYQLEKNPADGCCIRCGRNQMRKRYNWGVRVFFMILAVVSIYYVMFKLVNYMRH